MFSVMSIAGIIFLLAIGYIFSSNRAAISWRLVLMALAIQVTFGGFVLYVPIGTQLLFHLSEKFVELLLFARVGTRFLFGNLIDFDKFGYIFALDVFSVIIYFSALLAILYHIGVMTFIIKFIGGLLRFLTGASYLESAAAASSIFVGNPELTVRPYLLKLTHSELFVVFVAAMTSISAEVITGYIGLGVPAPYVIAASLMSGSGCLCFAKLLVPDTHKTRIKRKVNLEFDRAENILEAASRGATDGLFISLNVCAMLIAFLAIIALANGIIGWFGGFFDYDHLTIQYLFGKPFRYLAYMIGVPWEDAEIAGQLLGLKLVTNEFVAYSELGNLYINSKDGVFESFNGISPVSGAILCFAICGYANFGSIAVYLGSIGYLVPERKAELAKLGMKALLASSLSNLMSGTIAGLFISLNPHLI